MQQLIEHYGYLGIFIGTFLEGETILILGGLAAHQGYLDLWRVIFCAFGGSLLSDQLLYYLGRRHSGRLLRRFPEWQPQIKRLKSSIARYRIPIILAFRFWYGLRMVTPFTLGMSRVKWPEFFVFNIVAAVAWAVAIGYAGYLFGNVLDMFLGDLKRYETIILGGLALLFVLVWVVRRVKRKGQKGLDDEA